MTYYTKSGAVSVFSIPALAPLPADSSALGTLNYYRREKSRNRRLAHRIDACGGTPEDIAILREALYARETALSPIGAQIGRAIVQLPSVNAKLALELRYLECLTISETAAEMRYSRSGVQKLIRRSIPQLRMPTPHPSKNQQEESDL